MSGFCKEQVFILSVICWDSPGHLVSFCTKLQKCSFSFEAQNLWQEEYYPIDKIKHRISIGFWTDFVNKHVMCVKNASYLYVDYLGLPVTVFKWTFFKP